MLGTTVVEVVGIMVSHGVSEGDGVDEAVVDTGAPLGPPDGGVDGGGEVAPATQVMGISLCSVSHVPGLRSAMLLRSRCNRSKVTSMIVTGEV
jgi:hypothetical protein